MRMPIALLALALAPAASAQTTGPSLTEDQLFAQLDLALVKADGLRVRTQNAGEANLTIAARPDAGLSLQVVEGQEEPLRGWLPKSPTGARPAPVGIYTAHGADSQILYVLAPS